MAVKKKKPPAGVPDWMVTYGDMMTLLFCFFVILVSMSEIKEDEKFFEVMESIQRAFGYRGGVGTTPGHASPNNTFDKKMVQLITQKFELNIGKSQDEGVEGANPSVKTIREGLEFTIGGQVSFEPGKAKLLSQAKKELEDFADVFKGMNTKIRVCGHAALKSRDQYTGFVSLDELSFERAKAAKQVLIDSGIRPERITLEACGVNEPLVAQAYDEASQAKNRRVSIIVTENLVEEFQGQAVELDEEKMF